MRWMVVPIARNDRELTGHRARHAAADRRVEHGDAEHIEIGRNRLRRRRSPGTHVDDDVTLLQAGTQRRDGVGDMPAGRQHRDDHIGRRRSGREIHRFDAADLPHEIGGAARHCVIDRDCDAGAEQARGHRPAHIADADEQGALRRAHAPSFLAMAPSASSTSCAALKASRPAGMPQ